MPITMTATSTRNTPDAPTVVEEFVVHLPEEIVAASRASERAGELVVVCCREESQAEILATMLLGAGVGSAVISARTSTFDVRATVEAFSFGDFTVLLATDDVVPAWQAPQTCRTLLHADLPALAGTWQFYAQLRQRRRNVPALAEADPVAQPL